jgi:protein-disulfide isomerase
MTSKIINIIAMHRNKGMMMRLMLGLLLLLGLMSTQLFAAPTTPAKRSEPDPHNNAAISKLLPEGVRTYYLGNELGVDGWLLIKGGRIQIAYTLPDGKSAIIGALFDGDGQNISAQQMQTLVAAHPEIDVEMKMLAARVSSGQVEATADITGGQSAPVNPQSPGEQLIRELSVAKSVTLGNPSAPLMLMVMDPNCPHCKATWRLLRDFVMANKLRVQLIPVADVGSDNERAATQLLKNSQPLVAWDNHVAGDKNALAGAADQALVTDVQNNHRIIDRWKINSTPYMVYRSRDGVVKIVKGEITQLAAVVADLGF